MDSGRSDDWNGSSSSAPIYYGRGNTKVEKIPSFQVCFNLPKVVGRSDVSSNKPLGLKPIVTSKFYKKHTVDSNQLVDVEKRLMDMYEDGPREKFPQANTENQKYGWYQHPFFSIPNPRLNYSRHTSNMVKYQMKVMSLDQNLKSALKSKLARKQSIGKQTIINVPQPVPDTQNK